MNLRSFSLYRNYFYPLTLSNVGEPFWIWIKISKFKKEIKFRLCLVTISRKREIRHFHVVVVQKRQRNVQKKKVWYTCELLFCQLNLLPPLLPSTGEKSSFYCHYIFNLLGFEYSGISKEKSFFSIKSLRFQLFLYPCAFFMCVISSFNILFIMYLFIFIFICPIAILVKCRELSWNSYTILYFVQRKI